MLLISSCNKNLLAQKHKKQDKENREISVPMPKNEQYESAPHFFPASPETTTTTEKSKDSYNITLLLPLFLDEARSEADTAETMHIPDKIKQSLDLYQGIHFAFDSLARHSNIRFRLQVMDTKQDDQLVKLACLKPEFYESDLIIGPVYNNNLKIAASYAKMYEIPLVSPLSPADNLTADNAFFYMANPSLFTHCQTIAEYIADNYRNENILLIYQKKEEYIAEYFKNTFSQLPNKIKFTPLVYLAGKYTEASNPGTSLQLTSRLKSNTNNVVIIASLDLQLAHKLSRELYSLSSDYPFVLFGLPILNPENDLRIDYLEKINTHFTMASYVPDSCFYASLFAKKFESVYKTYPNETSYKGFDIAYFFGKMLIDYGKEISDHIDKVSFTANHTQFHFKKTYSHHTSQSTPDFLYFENKYVSLFRYDNYTLKRLR